VTIQNSKFISLLLRLITIQKIDSHTLTRVHYILCLMYVALKY